MGYQGQAIKGVSWLSAFRVILRSTSLIRVIILAKILTPEDFGVFGIAAIVLGFLEMATETGINVVLIQNKDSLTHKSLLDTAYVISILRGILIALLIFLSIPLITAFFNAPQAANLIFLIVLVPIIRGFINPSIVTFQKNLQFDKDVYFKSALLFSDALVAISAALYFRSAISMVLGLIASALVEVILSHLVVKPKPSFILNWQQFRFIVGHGKWITFAGISSYLAAKAPDIVIGRLLGTSALGIFQMAYRLMVVPIDELIEVFNKVTFPVYTQFARDSKRIGRALKKTLTLMTGLGIVWTIGGVILGPTLISLFLDSRWQSIIPLIIPLAAINILIIITAPLNPLYLALQKQKFLSLITTFQAIVIWLTIIPLTQALGITGAIYALAISLLVIQIPRFLYAKRILT